MSQEIEKNTSLQWFSIEKHTRLRRVDITFQIRSHFQKFRLGLGNGLESNSLVLNYKLHVLIPIGNCCKIDQQVAAVP